MCEHLQQSEHVGLYCQPLARNLSAVKNQTIYTGSASLLTAGGTVYATVEDSRCVNVYQVHNKNYSSNLENQK